LYAEAITPGKAECAVNFGPYEGRMQLAVCPLSTPDEEFDANVGTHITVAFGGGQIPRLAEGLTRVLEGRCLTTVEWILRESVSRGIFRRL
jgi:hypothetical protein